LKRQNRQFDLLRWIIGLASVPLLAVVAFAVIVFFQGYDRYDETLFTPAYQERYKAPFIVSGLLEEVLQTGNEDLYGELTGLRLVQPLPEVNPDIIYGVLLEVDEAEYFHYMFIDKDTFKRSMYFLEEVDGRWVVAPEDAYFLYHSGEWLKAYIPVMDLLSDQIKKPLVVGIFGLIFGLILGWFLIGWGIWPVTWKDALPKHLRADLKEDYIRMMADSYALLQDPAKVKERWDSLQPGAEEVLAAVESNPGSQEHEIAVFKSIIDTEAVAILSGDEGEGAEGGRLKNTLLLMVSLVFITFGGILAAYYFIRHRRFKVDIQPGSLEIPQMDAVANKGILRMIKFIIKRIFRGAVVLFIFLSVMYFLSQTILPYDFTHQFIMTRAERTVMQAELGLDLPLWQQYFNWLQRLVKGDATSFYGFSASENLKAVLAPSMLVFFTGTLISFLIGQGLGKWLAWRKPDFLSGATTFSAIALYTSFPPWLVFLLGYFFVTRLNIFRPVLHRNLSQDLTRELWKEFPLQSNNVIINILVTLTASIILVEIVSWIIKRWRKDPLPRFVSVPTVIGITVGSWYVFGYGPQALDILHLAALPIVAYVLLSFGETMIVMQTTMVDVLGESYVMLARAKGLPDRVVRDRHAARTAFLPVVSRLIVSFPYLLTGMVIIERAVHWPGMGNNLFNALYNLDMPIVMGSLLVVGVLSVFARLVLEIIQLYSDPRISRA